MEEKMIKKQIMLILTVLTITVLLSGCSSEQNNGDSSNEIDPNLFGTWKFTHGVVEQTYTFNSDGTFHFGDAELGTYTAKNGKLTFIYEEDVSISVDYSFQNPTTLDITDEYGQTMTYIKQ
jgi:hypothetical protein